MNTRTEAVFFIRRLISFPEYYFSADHGDHPAGLVNFFRLRREDILRKHRVISFLSRFQRSRPVVRESGVGRSLRVRIHGLFHGEPLLGNVRVLGRDGSTLAGPVKDSSGKILPTL